MFRPLALALLVAVAAPGHAQTFAPARVLAEVPTPPPGLAVPAALADYVLYVGRVSDTRFVVNTVPGFVSLSDAVAMIRPICTARGLSAVGDRVDPRVKLATDVRFTRAVLAWPVHCA